MKKTRSLIILFLILSVLLTSCAEEIDVTEPITYEYEGIRMTLPRYMRAGDAEAYGYDLYFDNLKIYVSAKKIDSEILKEEELDEATTPLQYAEHIIEGNSFEKDKIFFENDEQSGKIYFRYVYDDGESAPALYFITVLGEVGNVWYVEMCCEEELAQNYITTFRNWNNLIETYEVKEA